MVKKYKKIFMLFIVITIFLSVLFREKIVDGSTKETEIRFAILSDIHCNLEEGTYNEKLKKSLKEVKNLYSNIDTYVFLGDISNSGKKEEYIIFKKALEKEEIKEDSYVAIMGNHDYWNGNNIEYSKELFKSNVSKELNTHKIIKGYHFIGLSTENDSLNGYFSNETIKYARSIIELSINEDRNKPVFIFTHQPPEDTVYRSDKWGNKDLKEVFNEYPQVVLFSGHSHFLLNDEMSIYQKDYTVINSGSVAYTAIDEGTEEGLVPCDMRSESQGLVVTVKNNIVSIDRIDFKRGEKLKDPIIIDNYNKDNFIYTLDRINSNQLPFFEERATAKVLRRNKKDCEIKFSQARDDDIVKSYKIELYKKNQNDKLREIHCFSKYYLGRDMPKEIEVKINNIERSEEYVVKIFAVDCYGACSKEYIAVEIGMFKGL